MAKYILAIDDDEDILYTIQEICQVQGWVSLLARSFQEAEPILRQYGGQMLDLILVDYHLPQIDGIHAVQRIRTMGIQVPVIVLTVEEQSQVMEHFLEVGADDYALKPIKLVDFLSRINAHLRYSEKTKASGPQLSAALDPEKGINQNTLTIISNCLKKGGYMDINEIQTATQLNGKTIHRYLFYLVRKGQVDTKNTYGNRGRPRAFYKWI